MESFAELRPGDLIIWHARQTVYLFEFIARQRVTSRCNVECRILYASEKTKTNFILLGEYDLPHCSPYPTQESI